MFSFFNSLSFRLFIRVHLITVRRSRHALPAYIPLSIYRSRSCALFDFKENVILSKRKSKYFFSCASSSSLLELLLFYFLPMLFNAPASSFHPATPINSGIYERKMKPHREPLQLFASTCNHNGSFFVFAPLLFCKATTTTTTTTID